MSLPSETAGHEINTSGLQPAIIPPPTVWPVTLALGTTLLAFSIVTNWIIAIGGGVLFIAGTAGWFEDMRNESVQ